MLQFQDIELGLYAQIGILLTIATLVSLIMRFLKQPLIIGHIITGFIVGQYVVGLFRNLETLQLFSELGISFLLFSVGLTLNPKVLKDYGLLSLVAGFSQVVLTGAVGFVICLFLGYDWITSLYVGIALAFSSTVIVMKLLSDKGDLDKLYVKLSIGSLLLQDLIAIILLFALPIVSGAQGNGTDLIKTLIFGVVAGVGVYLFANHVIVRLHPYLTRSQELLFLFAIAWGMGVSALFSGLGFSLEGGALIAGISLASLPSRHEIGARLAPLRDFFVVSFFVLLGSRMVVSDIGGIIIPAIILSIFVLIGNPLLQLIIMGFMGYRKKTSFQTGTMAAQISEFSLILVALGVSLNQVAPQVLSTVTLVGIITIFISSYLILYSDKIYTHVARYLNIFERKNAKEKRMPRSTKEAILIGGNRIGYNFIELFQKENKDFLVIEHDPEVIARLEKEGVETEYGDANDPDLLEEIKLGQSELVVSTVPDLETNLVLVSFVKRQKKMPVIVVVAEQIKDALKLYELGADYVILPHFLGGTYAAHLVKKFTEDKSQIEPSRENHIKQLMHRISKGQEHPKIDHVL